MENGLIILLIVHYEQYYRATTGRTKFKFKRSPHNLGFLTRFLETLEKHYGTLAAVGPELFKHYLTFAFGKHAGRSLYDNKNVIAINWLFGKPTVQDFLTATRGRKWGIRKRLTRLGVDAHLPQHEVQNSPKQVQKLKQETSIYSSLPPYEEKERKRFFNTLKGYTWCAQLTTMHHPQSEICQGCKWAEKCRQRQELNYPGIYKLRENLSHD
jgi:hypothetical protein